MCPCGGHVVAGDASHSSMYQTFQCQTCNFIIDIDRLSLDDCPDLLAYIRREYLSIYARENGLTGCAEPVPPTKDLHTTAIDKVVELSSALSGAACCLTMLLETDLPESYKVPIKGILKTICNALGWTDCADVISELQKTEEPNK